MSSSSSTKTAEGDSIGHLAIEVTDSEGRIFEKIALSEVIARAPQSLLPRRTRFKKPS